MNTPHTPKPDEFDLDMPQSHDLPEDVIPFYGSQQTPSKPNTFKLGYDMMTLILLVIDLSLMVVDSVLTSSFAMWVADALGLVQPLLTYQEHYHLPIDAIGGLFTLFWVMDLLVRWSIAIAKKTYYRWFFFPFVHWYEVLGCFPLLRPLRLLRATVIIKRLHSLGIQIIPERWLKSARFYYHVLLEELSDRVILTAVGNIRAQMRHKDAQGSLIHRTIIANRQEIEQAVGELLRLELAPRLKEALSAKNGEKLAIDIGMAVERALSQTPEFRRYLKLIPIAGGMIEAQITTIGKHIGENVTTAINAHFLDDATLDVIINQIAQGVANIDTTHPEVQTLIHKISEDALKAFEDQVKIQQWKHAKQLSIG